MRRRIAIGLALLALLSLFLIVRAADAGQMPLFISRFYNFNNGDKLGHFLLMGTVAFLVTLAMPGRWRVHGLFILAGLLTLEEFSQLLFKTRTFSLLDLACSLAGVSLFGYLSILLSRYLNRRTADRQKDNPTK